MHEPHVAIRIDIHESISHDVDFHFPDRRGGGVQLPIGVRHANVVEVHEYYRSHPAAAEGFGAPGSDPANPYHGDGRGREAVEYDVRCQRGAVGVQPGRRKQGGAGSEGV